MTLLGPDGKPLLASSYKKAKPPKTGEAYGLWAGQELFFKLPGGGALQFDLDQLTVGDFRGMRDHYQVNASLSVLTFMLHQLDWKIECENKKIADHCEKNLTEIWTRLIRALSQSFWAGYSPMILQWENNIQDKTLDLTKIKDLVPEHCWVNWKYVPGYAKPGDVPPKLRVYDGIRQLGVKDPIPAESTLWYPLLMENGDHYGRKILRSAYVPWFFSQLMHLFSNRYFERFGEPVPVGRAPYDEKINVPQSNGPDIPVSAPSLMNSVLQGLRNRSAVVLPSERAVNNDGSPSAHYEYDIEYLESQMRGADFERYMMRLDEEISLALFTPLLVLRTADVGSYNLGVGHMSTYLNELNAIAGDWAEYINKFVLRPMARYNFSDNAPMPKIIFRRLGRDNAETVKAAVQAIIHGNIAKPNLEELGTIVGMTFEEIKQVTAPPAVTDPNAPPATDPNAPPTKGAPAKVTPGKKPAAKKDANLEQVRNDIKHRVAGQVQAAFRKGTFGDGLSLHFGYESKVERALDAAGIAESRYRTDKMYDHLKYWCLDTVPMGIAEFNKPDDFMKLFDQVVDREIDRTLVGE